MATLVGIKQFKDLNSVDDENMRLQLNRIERRSQEIGKNNRHILANHTGRAAVDFPDGQEHENAIGALAATRFLAVQAFARKLDGAGTAVNPSLSTEQRLTAHICNKNTLRQPDDDILTALKKFNEKYPFTEWWTTVVRYFWRFNGVNFGH